jgi:hypothetical protein
MADFENLYDTPPAMAPPEPVTPEHDLRPAHDARRLQRSAGNQAVSRAIALRRPLPPGAGQPLPKPVREGLQQSAAHDVSHVRIHDDPDADRAAQEVGARAFAVGNDIYFARGEYSPGTGTGSELLEHELAHTAQQHGVARSPGQGLPVIPPEHPAEKDEQPVAEAVIQRQPQQMMQANPYSPMVPYKPPLEKRVANFKMVVNSTAQHRLAQNARAMDAWRTLLQTQLTPAQVKAQAIGTELGGLYDVVKKEQMYSGGDQTKARLFDQYLNSKNPWERYELEKQLDPAHGGRLNSPLVFRQATHPMGKLAPVPWFGRQSPIDMFEKAVKALGVGPSPANTGVKPIGQGLKDKSEQMASTARFQAAMQKVQPYLKLLGPDGYDVIPPISTSGASAETVSNEIDWRIVERIKAYKELSRMIGAGEVDALTFSPIVNALLPMAEPDVAKAIQEEVATKETWDTVKTAVVIVASIALLIIAVAFPPALVIAGGVTAGQVAIVGGAVLGAIQLKQGFEETHQGKILLLGKGAHDVLYPEQQRAADSLLFLGTIDQVLGGLGLLASGVHGIRAIRAFKAAGWTGEVSESGVLVASHQSEPNVVLTVDGSKATMTRTLPDGEVVVAGSKPVVNPAAAPPKAPPAPPPPSTPATDMPATGPGGADELTFELGGETYKFSPAGPGVRIPATNRPFNVLEVGAGRQPTALGLPDEPAVVVMRTDVTPGEGVAAFDATKPPDPSMAGKFDAVIINNPYGYVPDIENLGKTLRAGPGNVIVVQGRSPANKFFNMLTAKEVPPGFWNTIEQIPEDQVLGGPFFKTSGEPVVKGPNVRTMYGRIPVVVEYGSGNLENAIANQTGTPRVQVIALDMKTPDPTKIAELKGAGGSFVEARGLDPIPDGSADKVIAHYPWKTGESIVGSMEDLMAGKIPMATDQLPSASLSKLRVGGQLEVVTEMEFTAKTLERQARALKLPAPGGGTYTYEVKVVKTTAGVAAPNSPGLQVLLEGGKVPPDHPVWKLVMTKVQN